MTIDWSRPIEAVHRDGRVKSMTLNGARDFDSDGVYFTDDIPDPCTCNSGWYANGQNRVPKSPWVIHNVVEHPTPTQYAPELVERMVALAKSVVNGSNPALFYEQARSIVSDLPQEVDPDLIEARERLNLSFVPRTDEAEALALACIKRGRQLERGEAA